MLRVPTTTTVLQPKPSLQEGLSARSQILDGGHDDILNELSTWVVPRPKTYFFIELSLSTDNCIWDRLGVSQPLDYMWDTNHQINKCASYTSSREAQVLSCRKGRNIIFVYSGQDREASQRFNVHQKAKQDLSRAKKFTSRPILKSRKTTPNSAIAFVPCTCRIMCKVWGPIKTPATRYPTLDYLQVWLLKLLLTEKHVATHK